MKVDAFAMSAPQVSAIISRVSALVPTSMPLFTKIRRGKLLTSSDGRNVCSVPLCDKNKYEFINTRKSNRYLPEELSRYSEKENINAVYKRLVWEVWTNGSDIGWKSMVWEV